MFQPLPPYCKNCLPRPTLWFIPRAQKKWSFLRGLGPFGG
eukprot:COSAG02_NODE_13030_length_1457_cov_2.328424_2_plen_39_part_01